jgi:hypothetical protein
MSRCHPCLGVLTALAFFVQTTGLAYAASPLDEPVPTLPSQTAPLPADRPVVVAAPPAARLPPSARFRGGSDIVFLKDGGLVRGNMVELVPSDHVTIELSGGEKNIVAWANIDRIQHASVAPPVAPAPAPPPGPAPTAFVHMEADSGDQLESFSISKGWSSVCSSPCDRRLPLDLTYRIVGDEIRDSRGFKLKADAGQRIDLAVSSASKAGFTGGLVVTSLGGAALVVGLSMIVISIFENCGDFLGLTVCAGNSGLEAAGAATAGAGIVVALIGVAVFVSNIRTKESQTASSLFPVPPPRPETSWLRAPLWREAGREVAGTPRPLAVPLFSRDF